MKIVNIVVPIEIPDGIENEEEIITEFLSKVIFMSVKTFDNNITYNITKVIDDGVSMIYKIILHLGKWEYLGEKYD